MINIKKLLGILGTITIAGSRMVGLVGNIPASAKNEINYLQTNNSDSLIRNKRGYNYNENEIETNFWKDIFWVSFKPSFWKEVIYLKNTYNNLNDFLSKFKEKCYTDNVTIDNFLAEKIGQVIYLNWHYIIKTWNNGDKKHRIRICIKVYTVIVNKSSVRKDWIYSSSNIRTDEFKLIDNLIPIDSYYMYKNAIDVNTKETTDCEVAYSATTDEAYYTKKYENKNRSSRKMCLIINDSNPFFDTKNDYFKIIYHRGDIESDELEVKLSLNTARVIESIYDERNEQEFKDYLFYLFKNIKSYNQNYSTNHNNDLTTEDYLTMTNILYEKFVVFSEETNNLLRNWNPKNKSIFIEAKRTPYLNNNDKRKVIYSGKHSSHIFS